MNNNNTNNNNNNNPKVTLNLSATFGGCCCASNVHCAPSCAVEMYQVGVCAHPSCTGTDWIGLLRLIRRANATLESGADMFTHLFAVLSIVAFLSAYGCAARILRMVSRAL